MIVFSSLILGFNVGFASVLGVAGIRCLYYKCTRKSKYKVDGKTEAYIT